MDSAMVVVWTCGELSDTCTHNIILTLKVMLNIYINLEWVDNATLILLVSSKYPYTYIELLLSIICVSY